MPTPLSGPRQLGYNYKTPAGMQGGSRKTFKIVYTAKVVSNMAVTGGVLIESIFQSAVGKINLKAFGKF